MAITLLFALATLLVQSDAARILLIPWLNQSHFVELNGVGKPLIERGHEVHVLLDDVSTIPKNFHPAYKKVSYKRSLSWDAYPHDTESLNKFVSNIKKNEHDDGEFIMHWTKVPCVEIMTDKELFPKLEALNFDLVIIDNFFASCYYLIPYKLNKPFISYGSSYSTWHMRLPVLASVAEPTMDYEVLGLKFCENPSNPSFVKRFCRLASWAMVEVFFNTYLEAEYLREYMDFPSMNKIRENASMTLVNHNYLISGHLPKLPHVEYIGGVTTSPAKALPAEFQTWMDKNQDVVVVSFGTRFSALPDEILNKMFAAFAETPFVFIMRLATSAAEKLEVPKNVRTVDWLPQNDLLGHNHTRLFVTHSGNNGQLEALYHGVPMLCFYVHADQRNNAIRVANRGYGLMMNIHHFTSEELKSNIFEVLQNASYSERIKKASRIFHSERHPALRAADAVEHVLKYGAAHLRPTEAFKLEWWQFYMLDILGLLFLSVIALIVVVFAILKCLITCICCRKSKQAAKAKAKTD